LIKKSFKILWRVYKKNAINLVKKGRSFKMIKDTYLIYMKKSVRLFQNSMTPSQDDARFALKILDPVNVKKMKNYWKVRNFQTDKIWFVLIIVSIDFI
jgi:hypothetical protein